MEKIDCFFVGYNELSMPRQRQLLRLTYGENSYYYTETNSSKLGYLKYQKELYSTSQIFNMFNKEKRIVDNSFDDINMHETFNLAIAYLGSYLHKRGFSIDYINSFNNAKEKLANLLTEDRIRTIAIPTSFYIFAYPILEIISFIRNYSSTVKILVGGTFIANQVRSLDKIALQSFFISMGADVYIYSNEGEYALSRVVQGIKNGQALEEIENIYFKSGKNYVFTKVQIEENSINNNPVNWNLYSNDMGKFVNMRTSISCPFSCSFCNFPRYAGKYRLADLEAVGNEIAKLNDIGKVSGMWIIDDTYNFPPDRFKDILRVMIKNRNKIKWQAHVRCQYLDEETVKLMKESQCEHVVLGIESGSQKIINNMNKKVTVEKYRQGISLLNEYNIMNTALLIMGFPGETSETYEETYNFIEETKPTFYQARLWWCDQDTPIYKEREKYKLEGSGYTWSHATMNSTTAYNLVYDMFSNLRNSIFESDFPIPFHLSTRGISTDKIKNFIGSFNECIRHKISNPLEEETNPEMIEKMRATLY
ncbi:radical SAM protein [Pelosinus fermentans]|uniref:Radical SAM domain protein n=1 Tax=Pelosinus fermentans JBW45 TaxID=1192197 RepID=I8TYY3_9FIRM|nr:radical SAM protein [Pelosinus fermentans]AJQ26599.1 Radical SAM domain protein [Pelosinus fermentans JBW45]